MVGKTNTTIYRSCSPSLAFDTSTKKPLWLRHNQPTHSGFAVSLPKHVVLVFGAAGPGAHPQASGLKAATHIPPQNVIVKTIRAIIGRSNLILSQNVPIAGLNLLFFQKNFLKLTQKPSEHSYCRKFFKNLRKY